MRMDNIQSSGTFSGRLLDSRIYIEYHITLTMLSKMPVDLQRISDEDIDKEILRAAIIAELDATTLYEQMASLTKNKDIQVVLLDIAKEEKTHVGEFQALLLKLDPQQKKELEEGAKEVEDELSRHK